MKITSAHHLDDGQIGVAYVHIHVCNGVPITAWQIIQGALPTGLTMGLDGVVSGTPTVSGYFQWTVRVTDAASRTNVHPEGIYVLDITPTPTPAPPTTETPAPAMPTATTPEPTPTPTPTPTVTPTPTPTPTVTPTPTPTPTVTPTPPSTPTPPAPTPTAPEPTATPSPTPTESHWRLVDYTPYGPIPGSIGVNYEVGDVVALSISNVTVTAQATIMIDSVDENGGVTAQHVVSGGDYAANPGFTQTDATGGSGTGLRIETTNETCFQTFTP